MTSDPGHAPARWEKTSATTGFSCRVFTVRSQGYRHPRRGCEREFYVVDAPDWVNVLALTPDGRLVLVRQFRHGIDDFSLEIPGGVMEPGEDAVAAALRELSEETGYTGRARLLGSVHPNPATHSNRCHLVLVEGAVPGGPVSWDHDEEIEVLLLPVDEVLRLARAGAITHALALDGLLLLEGWLRDEGKGAGPGKGG